ncbi:MAG: recombinase family protein, partial [Firmicutes bacterium]|nr:recombinase family protein [Bacillota bacterium]
RAIAVELNRSGRTTRHGTPWRDFTIAYILRNPIYTGNVSWQRTQAQGKHEPLISPELWETVTALLAQRSRTPPRTKASPHPLTGLLHCGLCGGPVHGVVQQRYRNGRKVPDRERRYYRCSRRDHLKDCTLPYLPAAELERTVLNALNPPAPPELLREIAAALTPAGAQTDRRNELKKCERALARWDDAYEAGDISREEWRTRRQAIHLRQAELQQPAYEPSPTAIAAAMQNLPLIWAVLSPQERKILLHGLLAGVTAHPDGSVTITHNDYSRNIVTSTRKL